jgi:crotonobetaine/carnitine-CoA ligase
VPVAVINPSATSQELAAFVRALAPAALIRDSAAAEATGEAELSESIERVTLELEGPTAPGPGWPEYWAGSRPDDRAGFIFTSGTTGAPKAVIMSQANYVWGAAVCSSYFRLAPTDRLAVLLPLHHVNAQVYTVLSTIQAGGSLVLAPRFSVSKFWDLVGAQAVTKVSMSIFGMEVISRSGRPADTPLRLAASGTHRARWVRGWGTEIFSMYGSSETVAPAITGITSDELPEGFIGTVSPFYAVRVVPESPDSTSLEGSLEVAGTPGRTLAQGYVLADGSFRPLDMSEDGWFRTGDTVECDSSGRIRFLGRADDMLKVKGENVSPAEIEDALRSCPGVKDAAVVGKADAVWGHLPVAVLELSAGADKDEAAKGILQQLELKLTGFKHPQALLVAAELPRSNLNKVKRSVVRDSLDQYEELWRSNDYAGRA